MDPKSKGGNADPKNPAGGKPGGTEPTGGEETDWEALYKAEKRESRKWEERAKANSKAADEEKKTAEEAIAALTKRLDEKEAEEARLKTAAAVAAKKGVPAHLLRGETEEEMEAFADSMISHFKDPAAPNVSKSGSFPKEGTETGGSKEDFDNFMKENF